jgi:hypothetical protein
LIPWVDDGVKKKKQDWLRLEEGFENNLPRVHNSLKVSGKFSSLGCGLFFLNLCLNYSLVVGDRRLLRFLRGKQMNVDEAIKMIEAFLKWRDDNRVDDVRQDIVYGGKDSPYKFPFGKIIIDIAPQIIISSVSVDKKGRPLGEKDM